LQETAAGWQKRTDVAAVEQTAVAAVEQTAVAAEEQTAVVAVGQTVVAWVQIVEVLSEGMWLVVV